MCACCRCCSGSRRKAARANCSAGSRNRTRRGAYAIVVGVLEPFYVGAGFAMYLNRRVELEAWDIEQEFRRGFR